MIICRGKSLKYSDFSDRIDYDKLYEDLGWEPLSSYKNEDKGYCLMPQNHTNGDTTGKLAINREKAVYNCWVCGGGSILSLVMEVKGLQYQEATAYLFQFVDAATKESPDEFYERVQKLLATETPIRKVLPQFNERVIEPWNQPHDWFTERHIPDDVRSYFKCGYDGQARRYHPKHGSYEGPGIILPHFWFGKLVGWQTRWLDETDRPQWIQKYTNTTDFPREYTVWGYEFALEQTKQPIVVESVPTALALIAQGYPALATFGSQITKDQLKLLRVFQQGILLAPDNDGAGQEWETKAVDYLARYIPLLKVQEVPGHGADLGDLHPDELSAHLAGLKRL